jgi:hypothetical protein
VIFNDKTKINRFNSNDRSWCWDGDGERVRPKHIHKSVKLGGGLVMIWECMIT